MKLYLLDLGYMEIDYNFIVAGSIGATRSNPHPTCEWIRIPMVSALIQLDDGRWVLYDTGCHYDGMNGYWHDSICERSPFHYTEEQRIENQLAKIGLKPEDIDILVMSHMHMDHTGNIHLFKHCTGYVNRKDMEYALSLVFQHEDPWAQNNYIRDEVTCQLKEWVYLPDEDVELVPGVEFLYLPGHTAGVTGMRISLPNTGTVVMTSDACYTKENFGPPIRYNARTPDSVKYDASIERVRKMTKEPGFGLLIFGHDWGQYETLKHIPEYYD